MKILCINGGGIFGLIPAFFLSNIDQKLLKKFSIFSGTSIGSQISTYISLNEDCSNMYKIMKESMKKVFIQSFISKINPFTPKFDSNILNKELQQLFGNSTLKDIKRIIFIPSYDIVNKKPKIFDNITSQKVNPDISWKTWEITRASSSAPTYFYPYKGLIDGGIIANDASLITACGLHHKLNIDFKDMEILVIGTGFRKNKNKNYDNFSILNWLPVILEMVTLGNEQITHFTCSQMLFKKYMYLDPIELQEDWEMDDLSLIPKLEDLCFKNFEIFEKLFLNFLLN